MPPSSAENVVPLPVAIPTKQRGRSYEAEIDDGYLERLGDLYEQWIEDYSLSPVVAVPGDDLDFVNDEGDRRVVLDLLERNGLTAPTLR